MQKLELFSDVSADASLDVLELEAQGSSNAARELEKKEENLIRLKEALVKKKLDVEEKHLNYVIGYDCIHTFVKTKTSLG